MNKYFEALERLAMPDDLHISECKKLGISLTEDYDVVEQVLQKAEKDEKIILGIEDYLNQRIKVEPLEDVRKAFIEIRNQLQVIKGVLE